MSRKNFHEALNITRDRNDHLLNEVSKLLAFYFASGNFSQSELVKSIEDWLPDMTEKEKQLVYFKTGLIFEHLRNQPDIWLQHWAVTILNQATQETAIKQDIDE